MIPKRLLTLTLLTALVLFADSASVAQNFWEPVSIPESPWFSNNVAVAPNGHVFALSGYYANELFVSTDDGVSWSVANNELAVRFPGIVLDHEGRIFGITDTTIICSSDEGKTWSDLRDGSFGALAIGFDDELYMVSETRTQGDSLLISNDHGETWDANTIDTSLHGIGVIAVNLAGDIFATGSSGVFRSTDRGQSWMEKDAGIDYASSIVQLLCDKHGEVFAGSYYGGTFAGLYFSTDDGETWSNAPWLAGTYDDVAFIALDSAGRIYAGSGAVWRSADYGNTWIGVGSNFSPEPSTMAISKSGHIFTGESNDVICRSTNEGNSWNYVSWWATSPSPVATGPNGEVLLGTQPDGMVISTDDGNTWTHSPILYSNDALAGIAAGLGGKIFASTIDDELYESRNTGASWELLYSGEPIVGSSSEVFINKGVVYADSVGTVVVSLDSGAEWNEADSCGINSIASFAADSEGNTYVGGVYSTGYDYFGRWYSEHSVNISKSSDSGKTWMQIASNLTNDTTGEISSFGLTIDDSTGTIFAATNEGIYRSVKGGSWLRLDSMQGQVDGILVVSPKRVYAYESAGVFYSTDDGDTWTAAISGLAGLPSWSMSIALDANGRLFVATDSGVFRSVLPQSSVEHSYQPASLVLSQNSPNPVTQSTTISFTLPEPSYITLTLYDATGREVAALANGFMDAGEHDAPFQRGDLPSGVYFYRLEIGGQSATRAMVIEP